MALAGDGGGPHQGDSSGGGEMSFNSECVCCWWNKWDFLHGLALGMREREESGATPRFLV